MAEFKQFTYTNTGTEIDFFNGFMDTLLGLDSSFTLEDVDGNPTTIDAQYADLSAVPRFFS